MHAFLVNIAGVIFSRLLDAIYAVNMANERDYGVLENMSANTIAQDTLLDVPSLRMLTDLEDVAQWMADSGYGTFRPFHIPFGDDAPPAVREAILRLNRMVFTDVLHEPVDVQQLMSQNDVSYREVDLYQVNPDALPSSLPEAISNLCVSLDMRDLDIFKRRFASFKPDSQNAISMDWECSRERIRQRELIIREKLDAIFETFHVHETMQELVGEISPDSPQYLPSKQLQKHIPEILTAVPNLGVPIHVIIRNYYGRTCRIQVAKEWVCIPSAREAANSNSAS